MESSSAFQFELPNRTVELLQIDYIPFHWEPTGKYKFVGGWIRAPYAGAKGQGAEKNAAQLNKLRRLLEPHSNIWVECRCTSALVPSSEGENFSVAINGMHICDLYDDTGRSFRKRLSLRKISNPITTCNVLISGGGTLVDGKHRDYSVLLDMKPFRDLR